MVSLYVKCLCVLSRNLSPAVGFGICLCKMFVCVVSLFQPSSMASVFVYVKCLCVLSRYLSPIIRLWYLFMLNVCVCAVSLSQPNSRLWYLFMFNVSVCCLVFSAQ